MINYIYVRLFPSTVVQEMELCNCNKLLLSEQLLFMFFQEFLNLYDAKFQ